MIGYLIQSPLEYYAEKTPGHPALSCEGVEISYNELNQRSNQLAQRPDRERRTTTGPGRHLYAQES